MNTMTTKQQIDCKTIVDFIYNSPDLPLDLRDKLAEWLLAHEHDENLGQAMSQLWDEHLQGEHGDFDAQGLQQLLGQVEMSPRRFPWGKIWRYAAAAVVAVSALAGMYKLGNDNATQQTVLLAAAGSKGEYLLPDSTRVWLNGGTRLSYDSHDFTGHSRRVEIDGEAYFEVTKDANRPFTVKMTDMEVEVLGTCFDVRNYAFSRTEEVVLKEGRVRVSTPLLSKPYTMMPDQRIVIDRSTGNISVSAESAENYCSWFRHKVRFEGVPLGDILKQVCRRYSLDLEVKPTVDEELLLSLTICNDDADDVMRAISYLAQVRYTISDNTLTVYK